MTRTKCAAAVLIVTAVIVFSGFILNIRTVDSIYSDISSAFESLEKHRVRMRKIGLLPVEADFASRDRGG